MDKSFVVTKFGKTYLVSGYTLIGTLAHRVEVYEPLESQNPLLSRSHSCITLEQGKWWGHVASRELPAEFALIPVGKVRSQALEVLRELRAEEMASVVSEVMTLPAHTEFDGHRFCYSGV